MTHYFVASNIVDITLMVKMIPIYNSEPSDWKDLQLKVAKIFSDMGFETKVEKEVNLVRGTVNVDVFAIKTNFTTKQIQIVECKYWKESVDKSVVHSVRTILADSGANAGFVISRNGFQKGAFEAARNSNLNLLSFEEFQSEFRTAWLDAVVDELELLGYPLRKYSDPLESFCDHELTILGPDKQEQFHNLVAKYHYVALKTFRGLYKNIISGQLELEYIDEVVRRNSKEFSGSVRVMCLMDYFEYLKSVCINGVREFDEFFGKKLRKG